MWPHLSTLVLCPWTPGQNIRPTCGEKRKSIRVEKKQQNKTSPKENPSQPTAHFLAVNQAYTNHEEKLIQLRTQKISTSRRCNKTERQLQAQGVHIHPKGNWLQRQKSKKSFTSASLDEAPTAHFPLLRPPSNLSFAPPQPHPECVLKSVTFLKGQVHWPILSQHSFDLPAAPWPAGLISASGLLCWPISSFEDSNCVLPTPSLPLSHDIASDFNLAGSRFCGARSLCNFWRNFLKDNKLKKNAYILNTRLDMCPGKVRDMKTSAPRQIHFWFCHYSGTLESGVPIISQIQIQIQKPTHLSLKTRTLPAHIPYFKPDFWN